MKKIISIFAGYATTGIVDDYSIHLIRELSSFSDVIAVFDNELTKSELSKIEEHTIHQICSPHSEHDFGSYKRGFHWALQNKLNAVNERILFCNDSIIGPFHPLKSIIQQFENDHFWGLSKIVNNPAWDDHLQSYFICISNDIYNSDIFQNFIAEIKQQPTRMEVVKKYEIGLSKLIDSMGFHGNSLIKSPKYLLGQGNVFDLIHQGFPFIKKHIFNTIDNGYYVPPIALWKEALSPFNYPLEHIENHISSNFSPENITEYYNLHTFNIVKQTVTRFMKEHTDRKVCFWGINKPFTYIGTHLDPESDYYLIDKHCNGYTYFNKTVQSPDAITKISPDTVVICSYAYFKEIEGEINTLIAKPISIISINELLIEDYHECMNLFNMKSGLEIGGPSPFFYENGILPFYKVAKRVDNINFSASTVWTGSIDEEGGFIADNRTLGRQYIADGTHLPTVPEKHYDFVLSCNNIEHIANPMKAIAVWTSKLKPGGVMLIIAPKKSSNFDHRRSFTPFSHILEDYEIGVEESDMAHFDEITQLHNLSLDASSGTYEQFKARSLDNINNRCLHQHVFNITTLTEMLEFFNYEVITSHSFEYDYVVIAKLNE